MRGLTKFKKLKSWLKKKPAKIGPLLVAAIIIAGGFLIWQKTTVHGDTFYTQTVVDSNSISRTSFGLGEKGYLNIRTYLDNVTGAKIEVKEQFSQEVKYLQVASVVDKGSRTYTPTISNSSGLYTFQLSSINYQYYCNPGETACISRATNQGGGQYLLSGNYIDWKIELEFVAPGVFDLNSNYTGCESQNPTQNANKSMVSYYSNQVLTRNAFLGPTCVTSGELSANIVKTLELNKGGELTTANTFEAGDLVHVTLTIYEPNERQSNYKITDSLPKSISGQVEVKLSSPQGEVAKENLTISPDHTITVEGNEQKTLQKGVNRIEYEYRI